MTKGTHAMILMRRSSPHSEAVEEEERQEAREQGDKECRPVLEKPDKPHAIPYLCLLLQKQAWINLWGIL